MHSNDGLGRTSKTIATNFWFIMNLIRFKQRSFYAVFRLNLNFLS
jgi:hypothetical protein